MSEHKADDGPGWEIGLIDSAWHGSAFDGHAGHVQARAIGFETLDMFIGYDPGSLSRQERGALIAEVRGVGLPIRSLVCTALGLSDFNTAIRGFHVARALNIIDLATELGTVRN